MAVCRYALSDVCTVSCARFSQSVANRSCRGTTTGNRFAVSPGTYLLVRKGVTTKLTGNSRWKNLTISEFTAPATSLRQTCVLHQPVYEATAGQPLTLDATVVSRNEPDSVKAHIYGGNGRPERIRLVRRSGYQYTAMLPARLVREGVLYYYITVAEKGATHTYPAGLAGSPTDWDFYQDSPYQRK